MERRKKPVDSPDEDRERLARELELAVYDAEPGGVEGYLSIATDMMSGLRIHVGLVENTLHEDAGWFVVRHKMEALKEQDKEMRFEVVAQLVNLPLHSE